MSINELNSIICNHKVSEAPHIMKLVGGWKICTIAIGKDHTATLLIDDESLAELKNMQSDLAGASTMTKPIEDKLAHAKREIKALKVQLEQLKEKVAEANTGRDSALDEAVVAWGEIDAVRARAAKLDRMRNADFRRARPFDYLGGS
jgi:septal ring factor EnvC (AmiA/AmiB activator)